MSNKKQAPRITQELLEYLEETFQVGDVIDNATDIRELGMVQGIRGVVNHLRFVKVEQDKMEGFTNVS